MDFLRFGELTFHPQNNIGSLCEHLNNIIGYGIWYDTFSPQNTKWLSLIKNIVASINSDGIIGGCFGLYPSYVAGVLHSVDNSFLRSVQ
jgi:hypothetical protein